MKGKILVGVILVTLVLTAGAAMAAKGGKSAGCATIQDGGLLDVAGNLIFVGYDQFGYNYQSHMFNGRYCDSDRIIGGDYCDVDLIMKWNDAWLSNKNCDDNSLLDRHYGSASYIGSGAWLTNHQSGIYINENGKKCKWTYFVKIVAAPADAGAVEGIWYTAGGTEIGSVIWGSFAIIQQVENDPCVGLHGVSYLSPAPTGFGYYQ